MAKSKMAGSKMAGSYILDEDPSLNSPQLNPAQHSSTQLSPAHRTYSEGNPSLFITAWFSFTVKCFWLVSDVSLQENIDQYSSQLPVLVSPNITVGWSTVRMQGWSFQPCPSRLKGL